MVDNKVSVPEKSKILDLVDQLHSENGLERQSARKELVKIGPVPFDYLSDMLSSAKHLFRWEALKVTEEIGDPASIPVFLEFLEDENGDFRWIAGNGLIRIGRKSVGPLLDLIADKYDSIFVLDAAHHVFHDLDERKLLPEGFPVDELLQNLKHAGQSERLKLLIYKIKKDFNY